MPGLERSGQEWDLAPYCLEVKSPSRTVGVLLCLCNFWRKSCEQPKAQSGTEQGNGLRARGAPTVHHFPVRPSSQVTGENSAPGGLRMGPARRAQGLSAPTAHTSHSCRKQREPCWRWGSASADMR